MGRGRIGWAMCDGGLNEWWVDDEWMLTLKVYIPAIPATASSWIITNKVLLPSFSLDGDQADQTLISRSCTRLQTYLQ